MLSDEVLNILEDLASELVGEMELDFYFMKMNSPIEQIFWANWKFLDSSFKNKQSLIYQFPIGKYFADFYIPALNKVVELDGHQWHEKTPAQAENDRIRERFIQDKGFVVVRFTGREILRSAQDHVYKLYEEATEKTNGLA